MGRGGSSSRPDSERPSEQIYAMGKTMDGASIVDTLRAAAPAGPVLIGVRGNWYDVTSFVEKHPGGDVLLDFAGQDATAQFIAYHDDRVLKGRKPVGTYAWNPDAPGNDAFEGDFLKLAAKWESQGYFETSLAFIMSRLGITFGFLTACLLCIRAYTAQSNLAVFAAGSLFLAGFWQQSGFLMHDLMHNHHFHNRRIDQRLGWLFGCVFFGISSRWWRDEHNEHHLFTNTYVKGVGRSDPQMGEIVWAQAPELFPFFPKPLLKFALHVQHLIFVPILVIAGPIGIKVDSALSETRPLEFFGLALHWVLLSALVAAFPSWKEGLLFYAFSSLFLGVLSIQLLISHYSKPFEEKHVVKEAGSWARRQIEAIIDITCPPYLDWFHGGLNLHSPHHLCPRMCRAHYRKVHPELIDLCKKHDVKLDVMPFCDAVKATVRHLRKVGLQGLLEMSAH